MEVQPMQTDHVLVLYAVIAFLVGLLIRDFLPSYVRKKAENVATKEDIAQITREIEDVRSEIDIGSSAHKSYIEQRNESLVGFYDEITTFHYELMAVNFGDFPMDEGISLFEYQQNYYKSVAEIVKRYQRIVIYLPPGSVLLGIANEITSNVVECRKVLKQHFGKIKSTAVAEAHAYNNVDHEGKEPHRAAAKEADAANKIFWDSMRPHVEAFRSLYQAYLTALNEYFSKAEKRA